MSARVAAADDRDWWMPHAMLTAFVVLVAAILRIVLGWSAPLHVWIVLAGLSMAVLAADAAGRGVRDVGARRWRDAAFAGAFALALVSMGAAMVLAGAMRGSRDGVFLDAPFDDAGAR